MANNGGTTAKNGRSQESAGHHPGQEQPTKSFQDLDTTEVEQALAGFVPEWTSWFVRNHGSASDALSCLRVGSVVLAVHARITGDHSVTKYTAQELNNATRMLPEVVGEDHVPLLVQAVMLYHEWLGESGSWTGTKEEHAEVSTFLREMNADIDAEPEAIVPEIPLEIELSAFEGTALIQHAHALIGWVGQGVPATATGAIRLKDITVAAACVGVLALPAGKSGETESGQPQTEIGPATYRVRSMAEVPILGPLWLVLLEAGILEARSTKVVPGPACAAFSGPSSLGKLGAYRRYVTRFLGMWMKAETGRFVQSESLANAYNDIFAAAMFGEPLETGGLLTADDAETASALPMGSSAGRSIMGGLRTLAGLGLMELDKQIWIRPELAWCYAEAFAADWEFEVSYPEAE